VIYNIDLLAIALLYVLQVEIECVVDKPALPRPSSRVDMLKSTDGRASPQSRSESPSSVTEFRKPNSDELVQVVGDGYQLITSVSSPHYCWTSASLVS